MNLPQRDCKVLCVDDEANVLEGLRRQLRRTFNVATALGAREALRIIREKGPFAVVITDYNMPDIDGVGLLREVHEISPDTVNVMLTGRGDLSTAIAALHEGRIFRFLNKPCSREMLFRTVEDGLEQYRLVTSERKLTQQLDEANRELKSLNEDLEQRVEERTRAIRELHAFVSELNGLDSLEDVARLIVHATSETLQSRRVSLMLPDASGEYLHIQTAVGIDESIRDRIRVPVGAPVAGRVFQDASMVVMNERPHVEDDWQRYDTDFFVSCPLASATMSTPSGPVGVLNLTERTNGGRYTHEDAATIRAIAQAGAIAIRNQIRLRERNEARDATILAMATLAEHRDPETGEHLKRVQTYCRLLSEALRSVADFAEMIDDTFVESMYRSSPLHDIGKVGIPDGILLKPARLGPEEFEVMKRHTVFGGDTLKSVIGQGQPHSFLKFGMQIAYHHHERFDGTGYPFQLSGDDIPLSARIMSVADVYDALVSKRVYKKAMSHEQAVSIIEQGAGTQFDPRIVEVFLETAPEFHRVASANGAAGQAPVADTAPCPVSTA